MRNLSNCIDPRVWGQEFVDAYRNAPTAAARVEEDFEGWMTGWFANAMQAMRTHIESQYGYFHVAELREDGWSLEHPLECRMNGRRLLDCDLYIELMQMDLRKYPLGRYEVYKLDDISVPQLFGPDEALFPERLK